MTFRRSRPVAITLTLTLLAAQFAQAADKPLRSSRVVDWSADVSSGREFDEGSLAASLRLIGYEVRSKEADQFRRETIAMPRAGSHLPWHIVPRRSLPSTQMLDRQSQLILALERLSPKQGRVR